MIKMLTLIYAYNKELSNPGVPYATSMFGSACTSTRTWTIGRKIDQRPARILVNTNLTINEILKCKHPSLTLIHLQASLSALKSRNIRV